MTVKEVLAHLENLSPMAYAEDFDNVGLIVGNANMEVNGILVALDTLESVIDEAIENNCNLVVGFHPIVFKGLKQLTGTNYVERTVIKAIKNDVAIIAVHTALDNSELGVNNKICDQLGLRNRRILIPQKGSLKKLTTYVPKNEAETVRMALLQAGGGLLGNYSHCSFNIEGTGTFMPNSKANPTVGERGKLHSEEEIKISLVFQKHLEGKILKALFNSHSYEEVAYEVISLDNSNQHIGMGMIGELNSEMSQEKFLKMVKEAMKASLVRYSSFDKKNIRKVAVLGGSGSFAISAAKRAGADAFITADLKYHDFFQAENDILLMDIGHYESEQYTKSLLVDYLNEKIPNFAIILSKTNTNPVKYL